MLTGNHLGSAPDAHGVSASLPENGSAPRPLPAATADEVVGPIELPRGLMGALHSLAAASGVGDLASFAVCVGALVARLPGPATPCRARIVRGVEEAIVPASGSPDLSVGFRTALSQAAQPGNAAVPDAAGGQSVVVEIVVSDDGRHFYVESLTSSASIPSAWAWAHAFLHLLTAMAREPDTPILRHPLAGT
jgi:hypothetical protein